MSSVSRTPGSTRTRPGPPPRRRWPLDAVRSALDAADARVIPFLRGVSMPLLRISLGLVFVWFGALKVFDVSPVARLVARTVYGVDPVWFVPLLGLFEVSVGVLLLASRLLRLALGLLVLQMVGTFLVLVVLPGVAFQHGNPLLLTVEGEFIVKNLVLISAALVVGSTLRRREPVGEHPD